MKSYVLITALIGLMFIQATPVEQKSKAGAGMEFFEGTWEEALKQAKAEDKLIFMDAYAVWCGPCKLLKRNVFPIEEVGELYNANFINVQMDMEKGVGRNLAQQYKVTAYPTLLFIDGDGNVVHKAVGYHPKEQFIALGNKVIETRQQG